MKKLPNKLSKLLSVVLLWGAFSVPFAFASFSLTPAPTDGNTVINVTVTDSCSDAAYFIYTPDGFNDGSFCDINMTDTWLNIDDVFIPGTWHFVKMSMPFEAGTGPSAYANGIDSGNPNYLGEDVSVTFGTGGTPLSIEQAQQIVNGSISDFGNFLAVFVPSILGILVALLALGMGIRYVRKHVSGRKF